ncbi:MAG: hypothetical protein Q9218_006533 [Villophora microphyllina]
MASWLEMIEKNVTLHPTSLQVPPLQHQRHEGHIRRHTRIIIDRIEEFYDAPMDEEIAMVPFYHDPNLIERSLPILPPPSFPMSIQPVPNAHMPLFAQATPQLAPSHCHPPEQCWPLIRVRTHPHDYRSHSRSDSILLHDPTKDNTADHQLPRTEEPQSETLAMPEEFYRNPASPQLIGLFKGEHDTPTMHSFALPPPIRATVSDRQQSSLIYPSVDAFVNAPESPTIRSFDLAPPLRPATIRYEPRQLWQSPIPPTHLEADYIALQRIEVESPQAPGTNSAEKPVKVVSRSWKYKNKPKNNPNKRQRAARRNNRVQKLRPGCVAVQTGANTEPIVIEKNFRNVGDAQSTLGLSFHADVSDDLPAAGYSNAPAKRVSSEPHGADESKDILRKVNGGRVGRSEAEKAGRKRNKARKKAMKAAERVVLGELNEESLNAKANPRLKVEHDFGRLKTE